MAFIAVMQDSTNLLAQVAEPALRALALAGAAGVGLRVFRVKATSLRLFTWTAVLYGALALPLLGWMLPPLAVPAPGFLVSPVASSGAKQFAEKLAFGWRRATSAAIKSVVSVRASPAAAESSFSTNRFAAEANSFFKLPQTVFFALSVLRG